MLLAETLLVRIEKKKIYEEGQFEEEQAAHRELVKKKLKALHDEIKEIMKGVYKIFGNDSDEVRRLPPPPLLPPPLLPPPPPPPPLLRDPDGPMRGARQLARSPAVRFTVSTGWGGVGPIRCCARGRT